MTGEFNTGSIDLHDEADSGDHILPSHAAIEEGRRSLRPTTWWRGRLGLLAGVPQHTIDRAAEEQHAALEALGYPRDDSRLDETHST